MTGTLPASPDRGATCLVTGATGSIGPALVRTLVAEGCHVRILTRRPAEPGTMPPGIESQRGDVTDPLAVRASMTGVRYVFHLAARLHVVAPSDAMRADYQRVNVDGSAMVAREAAHAGVRRLVFFSTVAVYGRETHGIVNEASPVAPETLYGETKLAAEAIALAAGGAAPLAAVIRPAAVYGPRVRGSYRALLRALSRRRFLPIGPGEHVRTLVFDEDLARAAWLAAVRPDAAGRVFNVTDGETHTVREILEAMCAALGRPAPRVSLPAGPARLAARLVDRGAATFGRRTAFAPRVETYLASSNIDSQRARRELGFEPAVGLREGWRRTVERMREAGEL